MNNQFGLVLSCTTLSHRPGYEIEQDVIPIVENIIQAVCARMNVYRGYVFQKERKGKAVYCRHLCMFIMWKVEKLNFKEIGEIFDRHRTKVQYGINKIDSHSKIYDDVKADVGHLINLFMPPDQVKLAS